MDSATGSSNLKRVFRNRRASNSAGLWFAEVAEAVQSEFVRFMHEANRGCSYLV